MIRLSSSSSLDYSFSFTKDTGSPLSLGIASSGDVVKRIVIDVSEIFDAVFTVSVGIPSDHIAISVYAIKLTELIPYCFFPYWLSGTDQEIFAYLSGVSATGAATIFLEK